MKKLDNKTREEREERSIERRVRDERERESVCWEKVANGPNLHPSGQRARMAARAPCWCTADARSRRYARTLHASKLLLE